MAPGYAKAHAGIATCYFLLGGHGFELVEPGEGMPAAKNAVLEALSLWRPWGGRKRLSGRPRRLG